MSVRTDVLDINSAMESVLRRIAEAEYSYGERQPDVETALQVLVRQIGEAADSIEAAWLRHQIDIADETKRRAEERIRELGKVLR